jgi:hypothetical protein
MSGKKDNWIKGALDADNFLAFDKKLKRMCLTQSEVVRVLTENWTHSNAGLLIKDRSCYGQNAATHTGRGRSNMNRRF